MRNFNSSPMSGAAIMLAGVLLTGACGNSFEDVIPAQPFTQDEIIPRTPVELAKQRGISIAQLFDQDYATKDCLTNTPYDPVRTDGGVESSVSIYNDRWLTVAPSNGNQTSVLSFEVNDQGKLAPHWSDESTLEGYVDCVIPK